MMTNRDVFKIWAPTGAKWTEWVRPVAFIDINDELKTYEYYKFDTCDLNYIEQDTLNDVYNNTAIFVDIPSYDSVIEGIELAKYGFRPIPLYNGTNEQKNSSAMVNNQTIELALVYGASELKNIEINNDAAPAFLLDLNRLNMIKKSPNIFDNSWDIYHQDIPSASYFLNNDIDKIVVRSLRKVEKDLNRIFYDFQQKGIKIFFTDGYEIPKEVKLKKPKRKDAE